MPFEFDTLLAIGWGCAAIAALAWWGDRRRVRRADMDAVGWVPWTAVFFFALMVACVALGLAAREWLAR